MDTIGTPRTLRLLPDHPEDRDRADRPDQAGDPAAVTGAPAREDYWSQVQTLRADLARLRPAN
jgi:hypothetical protein